MIDQPSDRKKYKGGARRRLTGPNGAVIHEQVWEFNAKVHGHRVMTSLPGHQVATGSVLVLQSQISPALKCSVRISLRNVFEPTTPDLSEVVLRSWSRLPFAQLLSKKYFIGEVIADADRYLLEDLPDLHEHALGDCLPPVLERFVKPPSAPLDQGRQYWLGYICSCLRIDGRNSVVFRRLTAQRARILVQQADHAFEEPSLCDFDQTAVVVAVPDANQLQQWLVPRVAPPGHGVRPPGRARLQDEFDTLCRQGGLQTIAPCDHTQVPLLAITVDLLGNVYRMKDEPLWVGQADITLASDITLPAWLNRQESERQGKPWR